MAKIKRSVGPEYVSIVAFIFHLSTHNDCSVLFCFSDTFMIQSVVAIVAGYIVVQNILNIFFSSDYLNQPNATRKRKYFTKVQFYANFPM